MYTPSIDPVLEYIIDWKKYFCGTQIVIETDQLSHSAADDDELYKLNITKKIRYTT